MGSSQNVSMVNTVLATIVANEFKSISDRLEAGECIKAISSEAWNAHKKVVFNGDGYCEKNQAMLVDKKGLLKVDSGIESIGMMTDEKNIKLFTDMGVFVDSEELIARQTVRLEQYIEIVKVEASCLLNEWLKYYGHGMGMELDVHIDQLKCEIEALKNHEGVESNGQIHPYNEKLLNVARRARSLRMDKMVVWRKMIENLDAEMSIEDSPLASIPSLLFIDSMK